MTSPLQRVCRNVIIDGRRTSLRLERLYWDGLDEVCRRESVSMSALIGSIKGRGVAAEGDDACVSSAVRVFVMDYFRAAATEEGHVLAGHNVGAPLGEVEAEPESDAPSGRRGSRGISPAAGAAAS